MQLKYRIIFQNIFDSGFIFVEKDYVWISSQCLLKKTPLLVNTAHDINLNYTRWPDKYAELYHLSFSLNVTEGTGFQLHHPQWLHYWIFTSLNFVLHESYLFIK